MFPSKARRQRAGRRAAKGSAGGGAAGFTGAMLCAGNVAMQTELLKAFGPGALERVFSASEPLPFKVRPEHIPPLESWSSAGVIPFMGSPENVPEPPAVPPGAVAGVSGGGGGPARSRAALPPSFLPTPDEARRVRHCFYDLEVSLGRYRRCRAAAFADFLEANGDYPVVLTELPFAAAEQVLFAMVHYGPGAAHAAAASSAAAAADSTLSRLLHRLGQKWAVREARAAAEAGVAGGSGEMRRAVARASRAFFATASAVSSRVWAGQRVLECVYVGRDRAEQKFRDRRLVAWQPLSGGPDWTRGSVESVFGPTIFCAQPWTPEQERRLLEQGTTPLQGPDSGRLAQWMLRRFGEAGVAGEAGGSGGLGPASSSSSAPQAKEADPGSISSKPVPDRLRQAILAGLESAHVRMYLVPRGRGGGGGGGGGGGDDTDTWMRIPGAARVLMALLEVVEVKEASAPERKKVLAARAASSKGGGKGGVDPVVRKTIEIRNAEPLRARSRRSVGR
jgi:hypothetical protein